MCTWWCDGSNDGDGDGGQVSLSGHMLVATVGSGYPLHLSPALGSDCASNVSDLASSFNSDFGL